MEERVSVILRLNGVVGALEALKGTLERVPWNYRRRLAGVSWIDEWIASVSAAVGYLEQEG